MTGPGEDYPASPPPGAPTTTPGLTARRGRERGRRPPWRSGGRSSGSIDGDLEIRPGGMTTGLAVAGWLATCVVLWAEVRPAPVAAALAALALLPWGWLAARARVWRARVVGDALHLHTLGRVTIYPLARLDAPVLATIDRWEALHLRLAGGVHLVTLSAAFWGEEGVRMLADRLGADRPEVATRAELVRRYPGSLTFWRRHRGWGYAVYAVSVAVAFFLLSRLVL